MTTKTQTMTQEEIKTLAKEYLGKWVCFKSTLTNCSAVTFIKPTNVRTYPQPELYKEVFLAGQKIKVDSAYQLEGLCYSENDYVVFTPTLKAEFPSEEQIAQFETIINAYNNLKTHKK